MPFRLSASLALAALAVAATPAAAQSMSVGTFLTRAAPLRANPLMALMSPDYAVLKGEADSATRALRADAAARKAAGKPPIACVPDGQSLGITDMLAGLDALPAADKRLPLKDGYARVLATRFPCR
jgi:hypothetical protein